MHDREVANRLVGYADAVVALAVVSESAFGIAIADPEIRCGLASGKATIYTAHLLAGLALTVFLLLLRRWEVDLGADEPLSAKGRKYASYIRRGRIVLLWLCLGCAMLLVHALDRSGCPI